MAIRGRRNEPLQWVLSGPGGSLLALGLVRVIDEAHLKMSRYGSRIARHLDPLGYAVGRTRLQRLMPLMGLRSVAPQPHTSQRNLSHAGGYLIAA